MLQKLNQKNKIIHGRFISFVMPVIGIFAFLFVILITFAVDANIKAQIEQLRISSEDNSIFDIEMTVIDEDLDDTRLRVDLINGDFSKALIIDENNLVASLDSTPDVNNNEYYQIGSTEKPIQTSLGSIDLNFSFDINIQDLPATIDVGSSQLRATLFDNKEESESYLVDISFDANSEDLTTDFYNYSKPVLKDLVLEDLQNDELSFSFIASGGMNNLSAKIEYLRPDDAQWYPITIKEFSASINPVDLRDLHVVDSAHQLQSIHSKTGDNKINVIWSYEDDLGREVDLSDMYIRVSLLNVIVSSNILSLGPIIIDNVAAQEIEDFKVLEAMRSDTISLSWKEPYDSNLAGGIYTLIVKDIKAATISEYNLTLDDLKNGFYTISGLKEDTDYSFQLVVTDAFGNKRLSKSITDSTNAIPEIKAFKALTEKDNIRLVSELVDLDGIESIKRNDLKLQVKYKYNDSYFQATLKGPITVTGQTTKIEIDNNTDYQLGANTAYIKGTDTVNHLEFFWDIAKDIENIDTNNVELCIKVSDLVEESDYFCQKNINISSYRQVKEAIEEEPKEKIKEEKKIEAEINTEDGEKIFKLNHEKEPYIHKLLSLLDIEAGYYIENFYELEGEDFSFANPDENINRLQSVSFILKLAKKEILTPDRDIFNDVHREDKYSSYIYTGMKLNIVNGDGASGLKIKKDFNMFDDVNTAEALVMMIRAFDINIPKVDNVNLDLSKPWYLDIFVWAYANKVIPEDLLPDSILTIGEFVEILMKVYAN